MSVGEQSARIRISNSVLARPVMPTLSGHTSEHDSLMPERVAEYKILLN